MAALVAVTALSWFLIDRTRSVSYQASALVIAKDLGIKIEELPKTAEAIFGAGPVAERAVELGDLPFQPRQLIPRHIALSPVEGTVFLKVVAVDADAVLASRMANSGAAALVEELARAGPGIGAFSVFEPAQTPLQPESARWPALFMALAAGVVAAGGLVGLLVSLRRPIIGVADLSRLTSSELLGDLEMLRHGNQDGRAVPGLSVMVRRLFPDNQIRVFVGCGEGHWRSAVAELSTRLLAESSLVVFVPGYEARSQAVAKRLSEVENVFVRAESSRGSDHGLQVVDGPATRGQDVPQLLAESASAVLVVAEGTPEVVFREGLRQFGPTHLAGIVFVRLLTRPALLSRWLASKQKANRRETADDKAHPAVSDKRGEGGRPGSRAAS